MITNERVLQSELTQWSVSSDSRKVEGNLFALFDSYVLNMQMEGDNRRITKKYYDMKHLEGKSPTGKIESKAISSKTDLSAAQKQLSELPYTLNFINRDAMAPKMQNFSKTSEYNKNVDSHEWRQHFKKGQTATAVIQRLQQNSSDMPIKKRRGTPNTEYPEAFSRILLLIFHIADVDRYTDQQEPKLLPEFESYIVEDEEGSGGYGTVYKVVQKNDGVTVATKCCKEAFLMSNCNLMVLQALVSMFVQSLLVMN
ncbi:Kinase like protein [Quillaja saponaria]|uniref:Kinase like protein n=1 Tax=Quillaja saponaria TaxID=32244 RepID=A0AAD7KT43_QUISA|nr:Kinase like protein [Quillaja saponaria]